MTTDLTTGIEPDKDVSADTDAYLRAASIVKAINAALPDGVRQLPEIPADYKFKRRDAADVALAFHSAFELSGGASALWLWAQNNPDKFYPLFAKFANTEIPNAGGNTFVFNTPIPANPLDLVSVNATGQVVHLDAEANEHDDLPE
jgi:hypothetical protein